MPANEGSLPHPKVPANASCGHDRTVARPGAGTPEAQVPGAHHARDAAQAPDPDPHLSRTGTSEHQGSCRQTSWPTTAGPRGEFCQTITVTDVFTGWTETRALRVQGAALGGRGALGHRVGPAVSFAGLDTDNGGEFIHHTLATYCADRTITFTRGRSYRKDDSCFVEQKNDVVVRRVVGYARYDTPSSGVLELEDARLLTKRFEKLNPAELKRQIAVCQDRLIELARRSKRHRRDTEQVTHGEVIVEIERHPLRGHLDVRQQGPPGTSWGALPAGRRGLSAPVSAACKGQR